jgi:hypothetical protein
MLPPLLRSISMHYIIAPHGITDLVHAHLNKEYPRLVQCYAGSVSTGVLLHELHLDAVVYAGFFTLSTVHFRHDYKKVPWACGILSLAAFVQNPLDFFFVYMVLVHVPNHYRTAWPYVSLAKMATAFLVLTTGVWSDAFLFNVAAAHPTWVASIVMGHVLYQEGINRNEAPPPFS